MAPRVANSAQWIFFTGCCFLALPLSCRTPATNSYSEGRVQGLPEDLQATYDLDYVISCWQEKMFEYGRVTIKKGKDGRAPLHISGKQPVDGLDCALDVLHAGKKENPAPLDAAFDFSSGTGYFFASTKAKAQNGVFNFNLYPLYVSKKGTTPTVASEGPPPAPVAKPEGRSGMLAADANEDSGTTTITVRNDTSLPIQCTKAVYYFENAPEIAFATALEVLHGEAKPLSGGPNHPTPDLKGILLACGNETFVFRFRRENGAPWTEVRGSGDASGIAVTAIGQPPATIKINNGSATELTCEQIRLYRPDGDKKASIQFFPIQAKIAGGANTSQDLSGRLSFGSKGSDSSLTLHCGEIVIEAAIQLEAAIPI